MRPALARLAAWSAFALGVAATGWGFYAARLFQEPIWTPLGRGHLAGFVIAYGIAGAALWRFRALWVLLGGAALYTVIMVGAAALLAPALLLAASLVLGRRLVRDDDLLAMLLGLAGFVWAAGIAVHFRVNYTPAYLAGMLAPLVAWRRDAAAVARRLAASRRMSAAGVLLTGVLLAHWLVALKPEVSADGLAMHMAAPATVAFEHRWHFDVQRATWAVMPMAADWAYTLVYLPGGEFAARLLNLAALCVLAGLLASLVRRWLSPAPALLLAALFAASPIVQLVTGSLMVENLWAAWLVGALAAFWRYRETGESRWLYGSAALAGTALSAKFGSVAFLLPLAALAAPALWRKRAAARACVCFLVFAAPPYLTAWARTGNPVFPFLDARVNLSEQRFHEPLRWDTPYRVTFDTGRYMEGHPGGFAFQYLCLLPLGLALVRRSWPYAARSALWVAGGFVLLTFPYQGNLRYLYPALPLLMLAIAAALAALRSSDVALFRAASAAALGLTLLDFYFLPASGWYHADFYLASRGEIERYRDISAPQCRLIEYLNAHHPGAPVLFVEGNAIAGLRGRAYTLTWHTDAFARKMLAAASPLDCRRIADEAGIRYFLVPFSETPLAALQLQQFLAAFTTREAQAGNVYLARLERGAAPLPEGGFEPAPPGVYDDSNAFLWYSGPWLRGRFDEALNRTITSCDAAGAFLRFSFTGARLTYVYTAAWNRGRAEVIIDGARRGTINLYRRETKWQSRATFDGLGPGNHTLIIRVVGDGHVDVDQISVGK